MQWPKPAFSLLNHTTIQYNTHKAGWAFIYIISIFVDLFIHYSRYMRPPCTRVFKLWSPAVLVFKLFPGSCVRRRRETRIRTYTVKYEYTYLSSSGQSNGGSRGFPATVAARAAAVRSNTSSYDGLRYVHALPSRMPCARGRVHLRSSCVTA